MEIIDKYFFNIFFTDVGCAAVHWKTDDVPPCMIRMQSTLVHKWFGLFNFKPNLRTT